MFFNIIKFELQYRLKRPATWIYFGILFLFSFAVLNIDSVSISGDAGQVRGNAPVAIAQLMIIMAMMVGMLMNSGIMGVPILRDFEHKTDSLMFTTPISKFDYLFGRFTGSFLVSILVFSGVFFGTLIGTISPWVKDADNLLPFQLYTFVQPFLYFVIPNLFITGALFFMGGTLTRNIMYVYVFGIGILVVWLISTAIVSDIDNRTISALIEVSGLQAFSDITRYWSPTQKNTQFVGWTGLMLVNRLFWVGIGFASLAITYFSFKFEAVPVSLGDKIRKMLGMKKKSPITNVVIEQKPIPRVSQYFDFTTKIRQILALTQVYYREIMFSVPFLAIAGMGLCIFFINAQYAGRLYDIEVFPTTYIMLELISGFTLFFMIIIVFYGGQLIWRERDLNMQQIYDALPISNGISLISKFLGFVGVHATLLVILMFAGILNQTIHGYFDYEMGLYLKTLFSDTFSTLILYTLLAFFIQVVSNNKFLGFALMVAFFVSMMIASQLGIEHKLFVFGSGGLGTYSAMNSFGHFVTPFSWLTFYWLALTAILFGLCVLLAVRGTDTLAKIRIGLMKQRFSRPIATFMMAAFLFFVSAGGYIYYNTNILNHYQNSKDGEKDQAEYEKTLKKYNKIPQPKIIAENVSVDIYPDERNFTASGVFTLQNKTDKPISEIHLSVRPESEKNYFYDSLLFDKAFTLKEDFKKFGYKIYALATPLQPNDSLNLRFKMRYETHGFPNSGSNLEVVNNGTFINNTYFPMLGYQEEGELSDNKKRKKQGLGEKNQSLPDQNDPYGLHNNLFGDDADFIRFEIKISTSKDQTAIAPGYLQKEWEENGRKYFHYKMDRPMCNFYNISSARYEVKRDKYKDINLEIYYDKAHTANLDRMMFSMKKSLEMFERIYGPYQYRQLRILEFPRYRTFAQSFANTVPYSEGIGFILNEKEDDVDMCFYVTAHEIGHQWWGHQVMEAGVKGSAMLSETMAQYSALTVMKHNFPPEKMEKFLRYELDRYLMDRTSEDKRENPMYLTDNQQYIHYRKGSVVMYALQDYIGEDSVNSALKKFIADWKWRSDIYPTAKDLVGYFRKVAPDSMQNTITDLFEKITLYDLRSEKPSYKKVGNEYEVTIPIHAEKAYFEYEKDAKGKDQSKEVKTPINDYIDIGVMGKDAKGKDKFLYVKREKIDKESMTFTVRVKELPTKAGIDPIHKLIDKHTDDNAKAVTLVQ